MILVLTAAGLGFIAQKGFQPEMLIVSGVLILVGIFGVLMSAKYYERFRLHLREAGAIRQKLDERYPELEITRLVTTAYDEQSQEFPYLTKLPLYGLWVSLHFGVFAVGALLTVLILAT